jgi:hypothetical protein
MNVLMEEMNRRALALGIPLGAQLDVTYRCNERCVHCYLDHDDHGEMTTAEMKDVLDQLADSGTLFLTLSGGEVFMRMDFFEILRYARELSFCIKIKTNAFMIREKGSRPAARHGREFRAGQHLFPPPRSTRRHHFAPAVARTLYQGNSAAAAARRESNHRQRAHAPEYRRLRRRPAVGQVSRRRVHHRPHHHSQNGWRPLPPGHGHRRQRIARRHAQRRLGRQRGRILRHPAARRRRRSRYGALQRESYVLLHLALRRRVPVRAVPVCPPATSASRSSWISGATRRR